MANAIKTRKLSPRSIQSLLACVFNGIFENYRNFEAITPQANQSHYIDNEQKINNEIMEIKRSYNPSDKFVITMEKFIETEYEAADVADVDESIVISDTSAEAGENGGNLNRVEKSLNDAPNKSLHGAIDRRMKTEIYNIDRKYAKYNKNLSKCPDYLTDWREFYLTYSYKLASCAAIDEKFYNYIGLFHNFFRKQLGMKKQNEIELRRKEIVESSLSNQKDFANDDDDCDVKIIEDPHETYSVSSVDDDDDFDEPETKKQKVCILS